MPLSILLVAYLVALSAWATVSALIIGHLLRYAGARPPILLAIAAYISGCILILTVSAIYLTSIDWQYSIALLPPR